MLLNSSVGGQSTQPVYLAILRNTGKVLVIIGVLDIAAMIYCITHGISYSSSLNIFAVIAGVFLIRGSLIAAGIVRWFSVFLLSAFGSMLLAWPAIQPPSLTATMIRLNPGGAVIGALFVIGLLILFFWLQRELGGPSIQGAMIEAGRKVRDMRIPAVVGVALVAGIVLVLSAVLNGESAAKAKSMALERLGPGYKFHVASLTMSTRGQVTPVSARVTAWNDNKVQTISVQWAD